ncbi:hypothetical protein HHI36_021201, partial [Cryptolaemus montrouzieri]
IGVTVATNQSSGRAPVSKDMVKMIDSGAANVDAHYLLSKNKQKVIDYKNVLKSNNISIINKINKQSITRINRKGEDTIIDHVLTNRNQNGFSEIILKDTPLSDHKSIEFEMNVKSMKSR